MIDRSLLAPIHLRLLIILGLENYGRWLDPNSGSADGVCTPFDSNAVQAWTMHPDIGKVSSQGAHLIEPYTAPPSAQGDLFG